MESRITTIDDLPDDILILFLSLLTTNEAVTTTAVSRRWRNLWHSVRILHFSVSQFPAYVSAKCLRDARQLFAEFISQTILHRPRRSPLEKFRLFMNYRKYKSIRAYVDSWVRFAITSKATELKLHFGAVSLHPLFDRYENPVDKDTQNADQDVDLEYDYYKFHFSDLINSSVKVLKLHCCSFCLPAIALGMRFDSIREIHLQEFKATEEEFKNLMALCVNVEFLSLDGILGLQSLKIVSPKLKNLKLGNFGVYKTAQYSVDICAPSLASISFDAFSVGKYTMEDTSSLVQAHVTFDHRSWWEFKCWTNLVCLLCGVERLTIQNMWIWFEFEQEEESIDGNDEEVKTQPEVESNEESVYGEELFHGKLKLREEIFRKTFAFNNLRSLELWTGYSRYDILGLEALLEMCPKLETMVLQYFYPSNPEEHLEKEMQERSMVLQIPCLRLVKMKNYKGSKNELFVVGLLKKHGMVLEKIVVFPKKVGEISLPPFVL